MFVVFASKTPSTYLQISSPILPNIVSNTPKIPLQNSVTKQPNQLFSYPGVHTNRSMLYMRLMAACAFLCRFGEGTPVMFLDVFLLFGAIILRYMCFMKFLKTSLCGGLRFRWLARSCCRVSKLFLVVACFHISHSLSTNVYIYIYMHTYIYIYIYIYRCIFIHIHIYTHTHICIHTCISVNCR